MPLVISSSCRIVIALHCGRCADHFPTVSSIESACSASSCKIVHAVKAFVLLPICQRLLAGSGVLPPYSVVPAARFTYGAAPRRLIVSDAAETCSDALCVLR